MSETSHSAFTMPLEAITYQPPEDQTLARFANGDSERMIHCNIELQPEEVKQLQELRSLAEQRNLAFSPSVSVAATRFISDARGDIPLALDKMILSQAWREAFFKDGPTTDEMVAQDLAHGVVYFAGRDFAMRPTVFVRPSRAPKHLRNEEGVKRLTNLLIFCLEYFLRYMSVPGKVENVCVIVDVKDPGYMPITCLLELAKVLSQQHAGRVWRFYVCNMNWLLKAISTVVQGAMTDRQREKIRFIQDLSELQKDYASHQLEEDFGGSRPNITKFFPFPMQPAPFASGCSTGPCPNAVQGAHCLLSAAGARGRLWDPALSHEENTRLEFSNVASDFFLRRGLQLPPGFRQPSPTNGHQEVLSNGPHELALHRGGSRDGSAKDDSTQAGESSGHFEDDMHVASGPELTTQEVCPSQAISCLLFKCTVGVNKRVTKV